MIETMISRGPHRDLRQDLLVEIGNAGLGEFDEIGLPDGEIGRDRRSAPGHQRQDLAGETPCQRQKARNQHDAKQYEIEKGERHLVVLKGPQTRFGVLIERNRRVA
jgi:hypothetical protein